VQVAGVDVGRRWVKVANGSQRISFLSMWAPGYERNLRTEGNFDLADLDVLVNGKRYFVGELAQRESRAAAANLKKEIDVEWLRVLMATSLACLNAQTEVVVLGIQIADYTRDNRKAIRQELPGIYDVLCGNRRARLNVVRVEPGPQAGGALWSEMLSLNGQMRDTSLANRTMRCIDVGYRDCNICTIDRQRYIDSESASSVRGMNLPYSTAARLLSDKHRCDITPEGVDDWLRGHPEDEADVEPIFAAHATSIHNWVAGIWPSTAFREPVYLAGGGAIRLGPYLRCHIPQAKLIADAQYANAEGFYRLGVALNAG
jgi:hypothetical protein